MLPSSHLAPINISSAHRRSEEQLHARVDEWQIDGLSRQLKNSKHESETPVSSAALLAGEFSEFISAASRLENSYRKLQEEVSELGLELTERNAALNTSLAEIERMRLDLQQIVDSMPCGVLVLDCDGQISMINPESRRLLGFDQAHFDEGSQKTLRQISEFSGINLEAPYENASDSDTEQEFCVRDSARNRWIEVRNRRLFHQSAQRREHDKTILILRDITAQKQAEEEREAGRNAMALAEITTILAHEIRNPLASLELFAELIEQDGDNRGEWVSNLRAGIRSLSGTVNNVLSFHGSGALTLAPVALSELIGNAVRFIQPIANQAEVSLEYLADHDHIRVMGNESALQQVALNLISNAIRHTPAGGSVSVSIRSAQRAVNGEYCGNDSGQVVVEFFDTGCGIRPDQIDHIFEPGFSGSGDTSGLGLAVCARLMKQHGGRISVSNRLNSGSLFTLQFPVLQQEQATA
jgi:two-component system sensor histidine kinase FlrB